ncbi:MAG: class I SAM-dependent methyltransferase [Bacteroidia bacterium]|nr:class I SAM-dependent methyltransferase [Bacteroidia bacterium]
MSKTVIFLVLFASSIFSAAGQTPFSHRVYGTIAHYFSSAKELLTFFDFHRGDSIAEIGAYDGQNIAGLSIMLDSVVFYVQDIDSTQLAQGRFEKRIRRLSRKYLYPPKNKYRMCIGTEKASTLPENAFDKILLVSAFHEFTYIHEMLNDIYTKLKPGGQLYILEAHCYTKTHRNYTAAECISLLTAHGFELQQREENGNGTYRLAFHKQ